MIMNIASSEHPIKKDIVFLRGRLTVFATVTSKIHFGIRRAALGSVSIGL